VLVLASIAFALLVQAEPAVEPLSAPSGAPSPPHPPPPPAPDPPPPPTETIDEDDPPRRPPPPFHPSAAFGLEFGVAQGGDPFLAIPDATGHGSTYVSNIGSRSAASA